MVLCLILYWWWFRWNNCTILVQYSDGHCIDSGYCICIGFRLFAVIVSRTKQSFKDICGDPNNRHIWYSRGQKYSNGLITRRPFSVTGQPFEYHTFKYCTWSSPPFKWFYYSSAQNWDDHCIVFFKWLYFISWQSKFIHILTKGWFFISWAGILIQCILMILDQGSKKL